MNIIFDTPDQISFARLAALKGALKLEMLGMRRSRRPSAYAILRGMGYRGTRQHVLDAVTDDVEHLIAKANHG